MFLGAGVTWEYTEAYWGLRVPHWERRYLDEPGLAADQDERYKSGQHRVSDFYYQEAEQGVQRYRCEGRIVPQNQRLTNQL